MVAHFTIRTYGVNQVFRFVEGIGLHRKSHQIRIFFIGKDLHTCTTCSELPSNRITMVCPFVCFLTFQWFRVYVQCVRVNITFNLLVWSHEAEIPSLTRRSTFCPCSHKPSHSSLMPYNNIYYKKLLTFSLHRLSIFLVTIKYTTFRKRIREIKFNLGSSTDACDPTRNIMCK